MYLERVIKYGVLDQLIVDHGNEFMLMLYLQHKPQGHKSNTERCPFVQTISRMVHHFLNNFNKLLFKNLYSRIESLNVHGMKSISECSTLLKKY